METIKVAISELGEVRKILSDFKNVRNEIKKRTLENLDEIIRFLTVGPGVVSPELTRTRCNKVVDLIKIWFKSHPNQGSMMEKVLDVKRKYVTTLIPDLSTTPSSPLIEEEDSEISDIEREVINKSKELGSKISPELREKFLPLYIERLRPDTIERGDVAFLPIGPILHYCIVFKVVGDTSFVISITTNSEDFVGYKLEKSRFFKGTAIYALHQVPTALVNRKFVMPYDSRSELNKILSGCEEYLKSNVLKRNYRRKKK